MSSVRHGGQSAVAFQQIANQVLTLRKNAGLTRANLAEMAGTSPQTIHNIEKGHGCYMTVFLNILNALDCDITLQPKDKV